MRATILGGSCAGYVKMTWADMSLLVQGEWFAWRRVVAPLMPPRTKHPYWEIPVDLVAAGETLCPGSSDWENAYLWRLALPVLPRLEELRSVIAELKHELGLASPSLDEYRAHLSDEDFGSISNLSHDAQVKRYVSAMQPLITIPTANSLSLLGSLVAETFITDQQVLLKLHQDAFHQAVKNLMADRLMAKVAKEFESEVAFTILTTMWQFPSSYHISSLSEPFISSEEWERIIRYGKWWRTHDLDSMT